jgi:hypothetical protein
MARKNSRNVETSDETNKEVFVCCSNFFRSEIPNFVLSVEKKKELIKKSKSSLKRKIPTSIEESPSKKTKIDINDSNSLTTQSDVKDLNEIVPMEKFEDEEVPPIEIN